MIRLRTYVLASTVMMMPNAHAQTPIFVNCVSNAVNAFIRENKEYKNEVIPIAIKAIIGSCEDELFKNDLINIYRDGQINEDMIKRDPLAVRSYVVAVRSEMRAAMENWAYSRLRK